MTAAVKKRSGKNVACTKTLVAKEGQAEAVQALCAGVAEFSQASLKAGGAGVLAFECHMVSRRRARPVAWREELE